MMDCHKCREAERIAAGEYLERKWSETPCAKCYESHKLKHCAKCERRPKNKATPWEKTDCASCPLLYAHEPKRLHKLGPRYIPKAHDEQIDPAFREARRGGGLDVHPIFDAIDPDEPCDNREAPSIAAMAFVAKALLSLPRLERDVVLDRLGYPSKPIRDTARGLGIPFATCHDALKRARERWPALAFALPMKSWKWSKTADSGRMKKATSKKGKATRRKRDRAAGSC